MITEDYVSFETAKLLKEKGFEGNSILTIYDENAAKVYIKELQEKHLPYSSDDPKLKEFYYTQPTLQMAMKWLREVHNIFIAIEIVPHVTVTMEQKYYFFKLHKDRRSYKSYLNDSIMLYFSYEEACEAAIKYCLENLI